jgi:mannose-6-phosphate isomerase
MDRLTPVIFNDAWGSHISIAGLQGRPVPSPEPESELWMGAHESGPAALFRDNRPMTLDAVIAAAPATELGDADALRFDGRLPFLLKVLAAGRALSIQTHPTAARARERRSEDGDETYVDDWAKPEMLVAVSPFEVFVGMKSGEEVRALAERLAVPAFTQLVDSAAAADDPVHAALAAILAVREPERTELIRSVVTACVSVESVGDETGHDCAAVVRVAEDHPDDIGLVVLLLMHHRVLEPGEYIDVPAGVLHSYISGLGVEVLANSDNVVRAGLTTKQMDVDELLRVVDPAAVAKSGRPLPSEDGYEVFDTDSDRFLLRRLAADTATLPADGSARVVFCLRGEARLRCDGATLTLGAAESAFVPARDTRVVLEGDGDVYIVTSGA